jgi:hypothetical protein
MRLRRKIAIAAAILVCALVALILLTRESPPGPAEREARAALIAERKAHQAETKRVIDGLIASGTIESARSPTDFYVDVTVGPRFYALDTERKKAIIVPIYTYYLTERNKTERDIFAVRLIDGKTGREVGAYQAGTLQMEK